MAIMEHTQLVLWDWNGTLLDDVSLCVAALNRLLERFGYSQRYSREAYREIFGFPIEEYYLRAGFDFSKHPFSVLAQSYMQDYLAASPICPLTEGAVTALDLVWAAGAEQVVLSASHLTTLEEQVEQRGIRGRFSQLLGLTDIFARSKVDVGRKFIAESHIDPAAMLMVGDSTHDAQVAAAMGTRCVLFTGGHQSRAVLETAGCPLVDTLPELTAYL